MNDSVITCDEIIEDTKTIPTNFNENIATCKTQNFYISLAFLFIKYYLRKYKLKQKHLLPFHVTDNLY